MMSNDIEFFIGSIGHLGGAWFYNVEWFAEILVRRNGVTGIAGKALFRQKSLGELLGKVDVSALGMVLTLEPHDMGLSPPILRWMRDGEIIATVRVYNAMFQRARLCLNTRTQRYEFVLPRTREESPRAFNTSIQATCEGRPFTLWPFPSNRTDGRGQPPMPFFGEGSAEVLAADGGLELQLLIMGTVMILA